MGRDFPNKSRGGGRASGGSGTEEAEKRGRKRRNMQQDAVTAAGQILDSVLSHSTSLKQAVYSSGDKRVAILLRLCHASLQHRAVLEEIIKRVPQIAEATPKLGSSEGLRLAALYEFLFGPRGLKTGCRQLRGALERNRGPLLKAKAALVEEGELLDAEGALIKVPTIRIPRYARINSLVSSEERVAEVLKEEGWRLKEVPEFGKGKEARKAWLDFLDNLGEDEYCRDRDVDELLVFPAGSDISRHELVRGTDLVLQDKASCLPVLVLEPRPGKEVADICAAPGMKTSHLADRMGNEGRIHSFERDHGRFRLMQELLAAKGVGIVEAKLGDFLRVDVKAKELRKVRSALLDPPCTGSGIQSRVESGPTLSGEALSQRLRSLANLQAMLLKQALSLPNLDKLVYSTCSIHEEENEAVIAEVVADEAFGERFEVVKALPSWKHRGQGDYDFAKACLRASPEKDRTNGFFVCLIQRKVVG